jgi:hypothetical protein
VFLSPNSINAQCPFYFGTATEGSIPPPYGSGTLYLYSSTREQINATYSPESLQFRADGCAFTFAGPTLNTLSAGSLHKVALAGPRLGSGCPAPENPCGRSYWIANASTVVAFMDAAPSPAVCPALLFFVSQGDARRGKLALFLHGVGGAWAPAPSLPAIEGEYDESGRVTVRKAGCNQTYAVDLATLMLGAIPVLDTPPGSAYASFREAVPASCSTACVQGGYNAFWDASG